MQSREADYAKTKVNHMTEGKSFTAVKTCLKLKKVIEWTG